MTGQVSNKETNWLAGNVKMNGAWDKPEMDKRFLQENTTNIMTKLNIQEKDENNNHKTVDDDKSS